MTVVADAPVTKRASLIVAENAGPTPIGIQAPTDPNYSAGQLTVKVLSLPDDGTVFLADGVTVVTAGEILTVAQLTSLEFAPTPGVSGVSSTFHYRVIDPAGLGTGGVAKLGVGPAPTTTRASLIVDENAGPTPIGIQAPTDPNYSASDLKVKVLSLPSDGTVFLVDGVTQVTAGEYLTVAQLTSLEFAPTPGVSGASSALHYRVIDPAGLGASGVAKLGVGPTPVTTKASLTVAENAPPTPIGIQAPTDANYAASQLTVKVLSLPSDGTILLADGVTPVSAGEKLTVTQLTGLDFAPTPGAFSESSTFHYRVIDPAGLGASGVADLAIGPASGNILTVGPGKQYATLAAAIAASHNGDTIQVQAGTYVNDFAQITTNITIEGVGGMPVFQATENIPNGKAILVTDANVTINNIAFTGARVNDANGAGIRYESGNLTLNGDYFYSNQEGLLAAQNPTGNLVINNSEFASNGTGTGSTHNLYIGGNINSLTINSSYFHEAVVGHEIKSRAANTYIYNSRIFDLSGTASYSIDLPNGGNVVIQGNVIQQGAHTQNPHMIAYGEEGSLYANGSLQLTGNTIINNDPSGSAQGVWNATTATTAHLDNTQIYGFSPSQVATGPNVQTNDVFLTTQPTLDTSHPWLATA